MNGGCIVSQLFSRYHVARTRFSEALLNRLTNRNACHDYYLGKCPDEKYNQPLVNRKGRPAEKLKWIETNCNFPL